MIQINNKIYSITYNVGDVIYINTFFIEYQYRKRGYSRRIINNLKKQYNKPIVLECWFTLIDYYKKLGFIELGPTNQGYTEMILK